MLFPQPKLKLSWRRATAISLVSLHAVTAALASSISFWILEAGLLAAKANSQGATFCPPAPASAPPLGVPNFIPIPLPPSPGTLPNLDPAAPPPVPANLPANLDSSTSNQMNRYRLGTGDAIAIFVQRFNDLNFQGAINQEGNVIFPLLGAVSLAGLTLEEAQEKLRCELNRYIIEPKVTLNLLSSRPAQVTVAGEVATPGFYIFPAGSQLSAALFSAGGTTTAADLRKVTVRRHLIDGSVIQQTFDLFTPLVNGESLPSFRLQDGDAVIVSRLEVGADKDYNRYLVSRSTVAQRFINVRIVSYPNSGIGNIQLANGSTFADAIAAISPNPDVANLDEIALVRFDPEQGKAVTQYLNAKSALMGDLSQNVPLQDNDVIVIGRNLIARISYALNIFTQPFRDILGFLLFFDSLRNNASNLFGPTPRR